MDWSLIPQFYRGVDKSTSPWPPVRPMLLTLPTSAAKVTTPSLVPSPSCVGRFAADNILIINQLHHIGRARDGLASETSVTSVTSVRGRCFCWVPFTKVEKRSHKSTYNWHQFELQFAEAVPLLHFQLCKKIGIPDLRDQHGFEPHSFQFQFHQIPQKNWLCLKK